MSIGTWIGEFLPYLDDGATAAANKGIEAAARHSLCKWEGMLPENLEEHELLYDKDGEVLRSKDLKSKSYCFGSQTCALCLWSAANFNTDEHFYKCDVCPLRAAAVEKRGPFQNCDNRGCVPGYAKFMETGDPTELIEDLKTALEIARNVQSSGGG